MNDTEYLNVDLDLESASDLSPLADYFADRAHVLYNACADGGFQLGLETLCVGATEALQPDFDADACIHDFIALITQLPPPLRALWDGCSSREFDIGFRAGTTPMPFQQFLKQSTIEVISSLRAAVRITIYPYAPDSTDAA